MKSKRISKIIAGVLSVVMTFCCVFVPAFAASECEHAGGFVYCSNGNGTHNKECITCNYVKEANLPCTYGEDGTCTKCGAVKPETPPTCDHMGNNYRYVNKGDGTHDVVCNDCGSATDTSVPCVWEGENPCICGSVKPEAPSCDHMNNDFSYIDNSNGTHNVVCNDCEAVIDSNVRCVWEDGHACVCGSEKPACDHMGNDFGYTNNGNGTHNVTCNDCEMIIDTNVPCVWEDGHACVCGSEKPACDHMGNDFGYTNNGNGTHNVTCNDCEMIIDTNVPCVWEGDHACVCGSERPIEIPQELETIIIKFLEDKDGVQEEVASGVVIGKGDSAIMKSGVYEKFEKEGYKLSGWKFGDKFFKAGQEVTFEEMAKIVGDNFDAEGNAILAFYPVFDKVNNPDNSGSGNSGNNNSNNNNSNNNNNTAGRANVNTGVL